MGKKRPNDDSAESIVKAKKDKVSEFNGTVFKAMLKEPTTALKGLQNFVSIAQKLPCADLYDVVEGYIKISMECAEIFKLLEGEKHTEIELQLIFQSLETILLRTASDLSHLGAVGNAIVKKTLSTHMKLLQGSFSSENHRFVRQCLSLLSAMVSQGPEAAREVLSHIHINKTLSGLAKRKDKKGRPDVRMAFVQFVLSFLVSGDNATIGQILEVKELLPEILNSGLKEDRLSVVSLIVSTLRSRIVLNKAVSKTQKVRFFSPAVLACFASLYKWNGIVDATAEDDQTEEEEEPENAGISAVRQLVHSFLLDLCCSRKHGISFHDTSLGTAGRPGNVVLLHFVSGLKVMEDELLAELLVAVLRSSPDLLTRFFKETQLSFAPRPKSAWQDNVLLLKKIYEAQPEISAIFQAGEAAPVPRLLAMMMVVSVPPVCNKAFFTQGLSFANAAVQHATLSTLSFILKRAHRNAEHLQDPSAWRGLDLYSADTLEELLQMYRDTLTKILPDMTTVVATWQSLSKKEKMEEEVEKKTKAEAGTEGAKVQNDSPAASETAEVIVLKALILQVICLYQKVVPHLVNQCKFDFSKLFRGIVSEKGLRDEVPPVLQYQILQLALDLPSSKFSWFRIQDAADADTSTGEKSVLHLLLKMFVSSSSSHLRTSTRLLVLKVLRDSGAFEYTWTELEMWLDHLSRLEPSQQDVVIPFLERVLVRLACNPHAYADQVAGLVQEASNLQASQGGQEGDAASIAVSHIDDVLDMLDVIMEAGDGEAEEFGLALSEDLVIQTFPFSGAVPAALEARNKLPADRAAVVLEFVCDVLRDLLHCQREALPLCLCLLHYDKELVSVEGSSSPLTPPSTPPHPSIVRLHRYYSRWLPEQCRQDLFKSSQCCPEDSSSAASFAELMRSAWQRGPDALLGDQLGPQVEEAVDKMALSEFPVAAKQILLYVKFTVDSFSTFSKDTAAPLLKFLMGTLQSLVAKLQNFQEDTPTDPSGPESGQTDSDLFMVMDPSPIEASNKEQALVSVLGSVLKHPCLEQWFLALELGTVPAHTLNPVRLKDLCAQLSGGVLTLLTSGTAAALHDLGQRDLLGRYTSAIERAVLKELRERSGTAPATPSRPLQALVSLRAHVDPSALTQVVSALLLLPRESLVSPPAQLSAYSQAALQILAEWTAGRCDAFLYRAHLQGLGTLLLSCSSPALDSFLLQTLSAEPGSAKLIHTEVLSHCLQRPGRDSRAVAALLLQNGASHRLAFELWCLEPANAEKMAVQMEELLPLISTYLQVAAKEDPARLMDVQQAVLKTLKEKFLEKLCSLVLENPTGDSKPEHAQTLAGLVKLSATADDVRRLIQDLPAALQRADRFDPWQLVDEVTEKMADLPEERDTWRTSTATAALRCLTAAYGCSKEAAAPERLVQGKLTELITDATDVSASDFNAFIKSGLKYRYQDQHFLDTLRHLVEVMYAAGEDKLTPLYTVHAMTSRHSLFLPSMLESEGSAGVKEALVSLLLCLVKKRPKVCDAGHLVVLLGAYGATMSTSDQKLLLLLQEYERNGVSMMSSQSFLWGPAAVERHKAQKILGASLWRQTSPDEVLAQLDPDRALRTAARFPQHRRLFPKEGEEPSGQEEEAGDAGNLYDPRFLLPLFSAILRPECVLDCVKFVSSHALAIAVAALSSYDPKVRAAAYHVLSCFHQHLEGARFREKRQLLYLLDMVKNGIRQQNFRLSFVLTTYISRVAQQMLTPEDHMYMVLNRFLLSHQSLDLRRVPEFFKLFYSFDMEHRAERDWLLSVLEEGLSDSHCYELCHQQGAFQSLLGFSSSPLCDEATQAQIIRVFCRAAHVTKAAYDLTKTCGLLTWLLQAVDRRHLDHHLLAAVVDLLHVLWFTNLGQKEKQADEAEASSSSSSSSSSSTSEGKPIVPVKCLPLPLINEFISVATSIIRHLRLGVKAAQLSSVLQTLNSALKHRAAALSAHTRSGWLTLPPHPLAPVHVLSLLHRWASASRDAALLARLQALSDKHNVKELQGSGKEKTRGRGSASQSRLRNEVPVEDVETDAGERTLLSDCKLRLCGIFVRWEPVGVTTNATTPPPGQQGRQQTLGSLDGDTVHLLSGWTLRCLLDVLYDSNRTRDFLRWLQGALLKQETLADALMLDADVKADLLRLYHHVSDAPRDSATLRTFTSIMLRLLERGGALPPPHQQVVSTCLAEDPDDQSRSDSGLALLSLYIHELWGGADSPRLFLSHVASVSAAPVGGSSAKRRKSNKTSQRLTGVRAVCNDIIARTNSPI